MTRTKENAWKKLQNQEPNRPMPDVIAHLKEYVDTYTNQEGYKEYLDELYIEDILYAIGTSLSEDYRFRDGYINFKKRLLILLQEDLNYLGENKE